MGCGVNTCDSVRESVAICCVATDNYAIPSTILDDTMAEFKPLSYPLLTSCKVKETPAKINNSNRSPKSNGAVWKIVCMRGT